MDNSQLLIKNALGDKYEIRDMIQSGGMGKIFLGIHRALGRKVAIKIIHQELVKDEHFKERFYREAKLAASLDHPGIIDIYDFGSNDNFDYIIMPFIDGKTFQERLNREGAFAVSEAIGLMIQIAEALYYAHQHNVYHRDIKPSNIMFDNQGRVILADFGISKEVGDTDLTATNTVLGSPRYMSPEQIKGETIDARSDLYSLGLVFYEMLTGKHPLHGKETTAIYYAQAHVIPARPKSIVSDIPSPLDSIIMRLLEKNPEKRYADGGELLKDLCDYKNGKLGPSEEINDATIVGNIPIDHDGATIVDDGTLLAPFRKPRPEPASPAESAASQKRGQIINFIQSKKKKLIITGIPLALVLCFVVVFLTGRSSKEETGSLLKNEASVPLATQADKPAEKPPVTGSAASVANDSAPQQQDNLFSGQQDIPTDVLLEKLLAIGNGKTTDIFTIWTDEERYQIGQPMRFFFKAKEPCYALIFTYTTDDQLIQIFPNHYQPSQFVQPHRQYEIPDEHMAFDLKVTGPAGTDTVIALVSDRPFDLLEFTFGKSNPFVLLDAQESSKLSHIFKKIESLQNVAIYNKTTTYEIE